MTTENLYTNCIHQHKMPHNIAQLPSTQVKYVPCKQNTFCYVDEYDIHKFHGWKPKNEVHSVSTYCNFIHIFCSLNIFIVQILIFVHKLFKI